MQNILKVRQRYRRTECHIQCDGFDTNVGWEKSAISTGSTTLCRTQLSILVSLGHPRVCNLVKQNPPRSANDNDPAPNSKDEVEFLYSTVVPCKTTRRSQIAHKSKLRRLPINSLAPGVLLMATNLNSIPRWLDWEASVLVFLIQFHPLPLIPVTFADPIGLESRLKNPPKRPVKRVEQMWAFLNHCRCPSRILSGRGRRLTDFVQMNPKSPWQMFFLIFQNSWCRPSGLHGVLETFY